MHERTEVVGTLLVLGLSLVGIVHSFSKHGPGDAALAVVFPPYAWYRGVECLVHPAPSTAARRPQRIDRGPQLSVGSDIEGQQVEDEAKRLEWPPLSSQESAAIQEVMAKVDDVKLLPEDVEQFRGAYESYLRRVDASWKNGLQASQLRFLGLLVDIEKEGSRCVLESIREKRAHASEKLLSFRIEARVIPNPLGRQVASVIESYIREVDAVANGKWWIDRNETLRPPSTEQEVHDWLAQVELMDLNYRQLLKALPDT